MSYVRPAESRGHIQFDGLTSRHTFSFGSWYDKCYMGESVLRVLNDEHVMPGAGLPTHGHQDMEILSYVVKSATRHEDTLGHKELLFDLPNDETLTSPNTLLKR